VQLLVVQDELGFSNGMTKTQESDFNRIALFYGENFS
jgi:hypothetical protein